MEDRRRARCTRASMYHAISPNPTTNHTVARADDSFDKATVPAPEVRCSRRRKPETDYETRFKYTPSGWAHLAGE